MAASNTRFTQNSLGQSKTPIDSDHGIYRDYVEAGALMGYAVDLAELLRRMADDVHQILKGGKPGDIPIYQPTKFELLINLKTAKALGLTLPSTLLASAAEVIE
jgi:ABC-type uncharacterized transport system substrate-binding protein